MKFNIQVKELKSFEIEAKNAVEAKNLADKKPYGFGHCFDSEIIGVDEL